MCMDPRITNTGAKATNTGDECQVTPVIHVLQYPGCVPKPIPSFACIGRCASYLQVSKLIYPFFEEVYKILKCFMYTRGV